jgi:hypothetical protein
MTTASLINIKSVDPRQGAVMSSSRVSPNTIAAGSAIVHKLINDSIYMDWLSS